MDDFLAGRRYVKTYTVFFDTFMPCATKKSTWIAQIAKAGITKQDKNRVRLCTVSDEAFALLLLENSFDRWLDLHTQVRKLPKQHRGSKDKGFQSKIPPRYTSGGIKYETTDPKQSYKGWSDRGRRRFNELFDHVKQDRQDHPSFETNWLESRIEKQEGNKAPKKAKQPAVTTRSELFDSEDEADVQSTTVVSYKENPADNSDTD
jgi:hypothetical protein